MKTQVTLLVLLVALNLADLATTLYGLRLGGTELNPLFSRESAPFKICIVSVYAGLFTAAYRLCLKEGFSKGLWILNVNLLILIGIYLVVVGNNLVGIMSYKGG